MTMFNELMLLQMAFWQAAADTNEPIPIHDLDYMATQLQPLAEDAVRWFLETGKAPELKECET